MRQTIYVLAILILPILLGNCAGVRSANGLSKGELAVGLTAPVSLSARYGIIDNLEIRGQMIEGGYYAADLFLHSHSDTNPYNVGLMIGSVYDAYYESTKAAYPEQKEFYYYTGFTVDHKLNNYLRPYISYTFATHESLGQAHRIMLGSELNFHFTKAKTVGVLITPELSYYPFGVDAFGDKNYFTPKVHVGFTFDFAKIFNF